MPKIRSKRLLNEVRDLHEEVRKLYKTGDYSMAELARKYGKTPTWVWKVIHKKLLTDL